MSSSLPTFFSKDALLRRQARFNRTRKNGTRLVQAKIQSSSTGNPLDIIPEEESLPLPISMATTRAQRRHALSAAPTALRTTLDDIPEEVVVFTDVAFNFPLPPLPTSLPFSRPPCNSPASSSTSSSPPSSPDSQSVGLPLTPSASDDELPLPSPASNLKRAAAVKPLVINKLHRPSTLPIIDHSEESDSEDSDSEWYTREFSKVLTLNSALPPIISFPAAHRDSISIAPAFDSPISPSFTSERRQRRCSGLRHSALNVPPPVPPITTQFLSPKCTKTHSITAPRRPPPRMSIPDDACSVFSLSLYTDDVFEPGPSPLSMYSQDSACTGIRQGLEEEEDGGTEEVFEFPAGFEVQVDCPMMLPLSLPGSPIDLEADIAHGLEELRMKENAGVEAQKSVWAEGLGVGFILEEADEEEEDVESGVEVVTPAIVYTSPPPSPLTVPVPPPPTATPVTPPRPSRSPASTISAFSFPPSPLTPSHELSAENEDFDERRYGLKSKWSSSTLSSVREEHASSSSAASSSSKFPGASKLKMYFQGQHKRNNSSIPTPPSPAPAPRPVSPVPVKVKGKDKKEKEKDAKRRSKRESKAGDILVIGYNNNNNSDFSPRRSHDSYLYSPTSPHRTTPSVSPRRSHDLPSTPSPPRLSPSLNRQHGHGYGVRRSPSQSSAGGVSDCGSEASSCVSAHSHWSSASVSGVGLRRKPIPVEMFLRGGV